MARKRATPAQRICVGLPGRPCHARYHHPSASVHRCPTCEAEHQRIRNAERTQYQGTWRRTSKAARQAQPWCSICGTTYDLTLDHEHGQVECRSHNSPHRRNPA